MDAHEGLPYQLHEIAHKVVGECRLGRSYFGILVHLGELAEIIVRREHVLQGS